MLAGGDANGQPGIIINWGYSASYGHSCCQLLLFYYKVAPVLLLNSLDLVSRTVKSHNVNPIFTKNKMQEDIFFLFIFLN